ncbi:MAG: YihA family ribosome biogenesis GTP-binding protein [Parvularculaceae bacterium]|nr:YihA family ribosome biogenesis GTP-binding protein [Parvularculaceae bacterium]
MADRTSAEIEKGRVLFSGPCDFMLGVVSMATLPPEGPTEIAFAGRSNVGKSTLLNALTGRNNLARASSTPGRTQEINYFDLGGALRLVDLPGFGYARAARRDARRWAGLARDFLKGRSTLRRVCLLVDARRGLKDVDREVMDLLDKSAVNYQIVLTKADKLKPSELDAVSDQVAAGVARRPAAHPQIIATSAETGAGLADLRAELAALC